ncbi:MAG: glycosyltransferase family 1 protein, partial [Chloroflexia bacterium]
MSRQIAVLTSVHSPFDGRIFHRECRALAGAGYGVALIAPTDLHRQERDGITLLGVRRPARRL